eukprot:SAG31_NODE_587_length_13828_cov_2.438779_4_plen_680_part_00
MCSTVHILDDDLYEADTEMFDIELFRPCDGAVLGNHSVLQIQIFAPNDKMSGNFQFTSATKIVSEDDREVTINVLRSDGTDGPASVAYSTLSRSALEGIDYTNTFGTLDFPAGLSSLSFAIPLIDDTLCEIAPKDFVVILSDPTNNATIGQVSNITITIMGPSDNSTATWVGGSWELTMSKIADAPWAAFGLSFESSPIDFSTDSVLRVTVRSTEAVDFRVQLQSSLEGLSNTTELHSGYEIESHTVTVDFDFRFVTSQIASESVSSVVMFANGGSSSTWDGRLTISSVKHIGSRVELLTDTTSWWYGPGMIGSSAFIGNNATDGAGLIEFSVLSTTVPESASYVSLLLTRTSANMDGSVSVQFSTMDGTATGGSDFVPVNSKQTQFLRGETTKLIQIQIIDDSLYEEGTESFTVKLSLACDGAAIGARNTATIYLTEDDLCVAGQYVVSGSNTCGSLPNTWWHLDIEKDDSWQPFGLLMPSPLDFRLYSALSIISRASTAAPMLVELIDCAAPDNCTESQSTSIGSVAVQQRYHRQTIQLAEAKSNGRDFSSIDQIRLTMAPGSAWSGRLYFASISRFSTSGVAAADDLSCSACQNPFGWWGLGHYGWWNPATKTGVRPQGSSVLDPFAVHPLTVFSGFDTWLIKQSPYRMNPALNLFREETVSCSSTRCTLTVQQNP